jgi:hypothetical protein
MERPPHRHLSLFEATCEFGQPELVAEMLALHRKGYGGLTIMTVSSGPMSEDERLQARYDDLRGQLAEGFLRQLRDGTLVAFGYDSRGAVDDPPVRIPADKWRVLKPDFADSSATMPGMLISGIGVTRSRPRLHIEMASKWARFNNCKLELAPRSFQLLAILAEAACQGDRPVAKRDLEDRLFGDRFGEKALAQSISKLKTEMIKSGVDSGIAQALIENDRSVGYRLKLSQADIQIEG